MTCRAEIASVACDSPADLAGLEAGMVLVEVEGVPLRDIIEWRWNADDYEVEVTLEDGETAVLQREFGEDWGLTFSDCIFDGVMTCCNACTFCFMRMLPKGMRPSLSVRDDDYRLSFLQGNFVTFTNLTEEDFDRIVTQHISPLHVSVHAYDDRVREELMGRNAAHGKEMIERLLAAGIEMHAQLVIVPGVNDGQVLVETLGWLERYPGILSIGVVPLGYTRFQDRFERSFSEDPAAAAMVIDIVREFQEDSRRDTRCTRFHVADEFYLAAGSDFPPAEFYDGYPQFYDGIGMMRSFLDDWDAASEQIAALAEHLEGTRTLVMTGTAFGKVLEALLARSPLSGLVSVLAVENCFFGGNVDVTGLLVGSDMVAALKQAPACDRVMIPRVAFNPDLVTLDDMTFEQLRQATTCELRLCTYCVDDLLTALR